MMLSNFTIGDVCMSVLTVSSVLLLGLNIVFYIVKTEEDQIINSVYFIKEIQNFSYFCDDLSLSPGEDYVTFKVRKNLFDVYLLKNRYVCTFRNFTEPLQKVNWNAFPLLFFLNQRKTINVDLKHSNEYML
jgi:hypothetical protein